MSSFLSNIFPWMGRGEEDFMPCGSPAAMSVLPPSVDASNPRKRSRTPDLVHQKRGCNDWMDHSHGGDGENLTVPSISRPIKFFRGENQAIPVEAPPALKKLPDDLLLKCLSFVGGKEDRFALQCTSTTFRRLSNNKEILQAVDVDDILVDEDTPDSAAEKLDPFVAAWNMKALYMLGSIRTYCNANVEQGISLLKVASGSGYVPAHYVLGLVLRDSSPGEAKAFMQKAVNADYFPAFQEVLSDSEMKKRFGDRDAEELVQYMDPRGLSRLLCRHYCFAKQLRFANTSHCWNQRCGRWAFRGSRKNRVSRMKVCSRCCRAKYCSKLCQVYDWRSGRHQLECQFL